MSLPETKIPTACDIGEHFAHNRDTYDAGSPSFYRVAMPVDREKWNAPFKAGDEPLSIEVRTFERVDYFHPSRGPWQQPTILYKRIS